MDIRAGSEFEGRHGLGVVREMHDFREFVDQQAGLDVDDRLRLIEQAEVLIRDLYVHLPLKAAMHAVDPVQRLRLLRYRVEAYSDRLFHSELLGIFTDLRDLHTNYVLPAPYAGRIAFLGILLERYEEGGEDRYLVSKIADHLVTEATLQEGVVATHWNGMPIELAVWRNADKEAGSNLAARRARGLENMTLRFLGSALPPDEDWVDLRYETDTGPEETRLVWRVFDSGQELVTGAADPAGFIEDLVVPLRYQVGVDLRTEMVRRAKKQLFSPGAVQEEDRVANYEGEVPRSTAKLKAMGAVPTSRPDEITAKIVDTAHGTFGFLRLWTFHMKDNNWPAFVDEVARLVEDEMPSDGLILDVRGNGGGFVIAAEFLLQLFTPQEIEPEPTQFINTPATSDLTAIVADMSDWHDSIESAIETAAVYSKGIPLSPVELVNFYGQRYHGPVVLITDAFCYSACDMFAAGFQDHRIGEVIGVDPATGAGGANVLRHEDLAQDWVGGPLQPLPGGASMRVSLRRTLRVKDLAGQPIEDLGVAPDVQTGLSRIDLLEGNRELLDKAGEILAAGSPRVFEIDIAASVGTDLTLEVTTEDVPTVDAYVNGRPVGPSTETPDGQHLIDIALPAQAAEAVVRLEGYDGDELVAARTLRLTLD